MSLEFFQYRRTRSSVIVSTALVYGSALMLSACGGGSTLAQTTPTSAATNAHTLPPSGKPPVFKAAHLTGAKTANTIGIATVAASAAGTSTVQLNLPADANAKSLAVTLNGNDVSSRFTPAVCNGAQCMQATLGTADGAGTKNVLSATVKNASGGSASGRVRYTGTGATANGPAIAMKAMSTASKAMSPTRALAASADVCDTTSMCPPWLPPSVSLKTLQPGGWNSSNGAWFQVNGQNYPSVAAPGSCAGAHYMAVVLDRQTLVEKTAAPESSPQCFVAAADLKTYLATLPATDLAVAGTTWGQNAFSDLDTTPIGGSSYAKATHVPLGYMVVGAGGQQAGTAYENYYDGNTGDPAFNVFATGTLQEDASGNYNFQSSEVVEYAVSPNDPAYFTGSTVSVIAMNVPADLSTAGETRRVYSVGSNFNGLWLLLLDRATLQPVGGQNCNAPMLSNGVATITGCGTTYSVASDIPVATRDINWTALATALSNVNSYQLALLVSSNSVGTNSQPTTFQSGMNYTGFTKFAAALQGLGGNAALVAGPNYNHTDSYSLVSTQGASNPLVGGAAEASTMLQQQGQYGVLHGVLQRNQNGLFQPGQTSQEPQPLFAAKGGLDDSDFVMLLASYQQPVDWPSNSAVTLLPGASSIDGQRAAYRFISHWLLAGYYMQGIAGPHQDDLHYFFSGSSNTWIDYHTQDPAALSFPASGADWAGFQCSSGSKPSSCSFTALGDTAQSSFTSADFAAVQKQMSLEVRYLTNSLQFLVTGSTNMKDVIASGNANVGLAITAAASTILGSDFQNKQVPPTTQVSFSWQSLLGMLGGIASTVANAEGVADLAGAWDGMSDGAKKNIKNVVGSTNTIGALLGTIGSGGSLKSKTQTSHALPQPFTKFTTTLGELANNELQSGLIVGFDVLADNITSDWARLSSIGPRVVNVNDSVFYAPNQVAQNTTLDALTKASSQSVYFSLLPAFYHVDYWSTVENRVPGNPTAFQPTVGSYHSHTDEAANCNAFYLSPNNQAGQNAGALSAYQGMSQPTMGAPEPLFSTDEGSTDLFVIAGVSTNKKTTNTYIPVIDSDLATILFAPDQLNTSMAQFVAANGPMPVLDASKSNPSGYSNGSVCDMWDYNVSNSAPAPIASAPGKDALGDILTTTTLTSTSSNTLGQDTVLTAVVTASDHSAPGGIVYFSIDGKIVGTAKVGADGTATLTLPQATLGQHAVEADYSSPDGYAVSSSAPGDLGIYAGTPDLTVTAASTSLDVSYDKPSNRLQVKIGSVAGMNGDVQLSCTGLPAGMSCTFDSSSLKLAADGSITASVVIGPSAAIQAALGLLLLPLLMMGWRREDGSAQRRIAPAVLAVCIAATTLTACGGGSSSVTHETGTKTVLINAAVAGVSRSVAVDVNIQ